MEVDEAVGQLTSGLAHDFNNILMVIIGKLDLAVAAKAAEGNSAVERYWTFALLFSDIAMPGRVDGIVLARQWRMRCPSLHILFASGFANPPAMQGAIEELGAQLISKPYRKADLALRVRSILERQDLPGAPVRPATAAEGAFRSVP